MGSYERKEVAVRYWKRVERELMEHLRVVDNADDWFKGGDVYGRSVRNYRKHIMDTIRAVQITRREIEGEYCHECGGKRGYHEIECKRKWWR